MSGMEAQLLLNSGACNVDAEREDRGYRTAFEKFAFANVYSVMSLQMLLAYCDLISKTNHQASSMLPREVRSDWRRTSLAPRDARK